MRNYLATALSLFPDGVPVNVRFHVLNLLCQGQGAGRIPRSLKMDNSVKLRLHKHVSDLRRYNHKAFQNFRAEVAKRSEFFDNAKLANIFGDRPEDWRSHELRPENTDQAVQKRQLNYYGRKRKKMGGGNDQSS